MVEQQLTAAEEREGKSLSFGDTAAGRLLGPPMDGHTPMPLWAALVGLKTTKRRGHEVGRETGWGTLGEMEGGSGT